MWSEFDTDDTEGRSFYNLMTDEMDQVAQTMTIENQKHLKVVVPVPRQKI